MTKALKKILEISSKSIRPVVTEGHWASHWEGVKREVFQLLLNRNGFYAFESALLFRPLHVEGKPLALDDWNDKHTWLETYKLELPELFFFAEDVFGGQFAILGDNIVSFDPETGATETIGDSLETWANEVLSDYSFFTGYPIASEWQKKNGRMPPGYRLVPKQLFVLGGEFNCENLRMVEEVRGMRSRGFFATELVDVPEGGQISFELVD